MAILKVIDGNEAAAHSAYAFTEVAAIYPITPSSPMAEKTDEWSALGRRNSFGQTVSLVEMQSEAGAIGAVHGALEAGVYATTFTSSQGLLLMLPVLHRIAGSRLPAVVHVAARTVGTHAMSIFGDHSDVMNCRATGFTMLASSSVQEAADLAVVAHLAAIKAKMPVMHFFDGFRTSHEIQKVSLMDADDMASLIDKDAVQAFRDGALNPEHPTLRNTVQNPDVYFQSREAANRFYETMPGCIEKYMKKMGKITGREYRLFDYYGAADATHVIVAMGSVSGTVMEVVDYLNANGRKTGFVQVHLYRPFSAAHLLAAIPHSAVAVTVLDRTKEAGAIGEPLYEDVCSVYANAVNPPMLLGGRYGLSSKDVSPSQIIAVFDNMEMKQKNHFTVGINDDVTQYSLPVPEPVYFNDGDTVNCKFWGLGSDGTVGANKNTIKIIGENTDMFVQAYFEYDTKKSFGITKSHLRFGHKAIRGSYFVKEADFVACHNQSYLDKYDIVSEIKPGGVFLLNCDFVGGDLEKKLPAHVKKTIADKGIRFFKIDANGIAQKLGLGNRINIVLQAAFFKLSNIIPIEDAVRHMNEAVRETYGSKGEKVISRNLKAVKAGISGLEQVEVPDEWSKLKIEGENGNETDLPPFIKEVLIPLNALKGDDLPVSAILRYSDGTMPPGTSAYEKRGIATELPLWRKENCVQCNRCSLVCPHAVIRAYLLDEGEKKLAPEGFESIPALGKNAAGLDFSLIFSDLDCTGCGSCANVCPAKNKALEMVPARKKPYNREIWEYGLTISEKPHVFEQNTVKGSQFKRPLVEFSGACAGCGETPYAKLLTQIFGDRMYWANATGCSQAWGASMPTIPYTVNASGKGPAWSNSLFEDNAEFAYGMMLASEQQRKRLKAHIIELRDAVAPKNKLGRHTPVLTAAIDSWLEVFDDTNLSGQASAALLDALNVAVQLIVNGTDSGQAAEKLPVKDGKIHNLCQEIILMRDQFTKKSIWMFGGDGWAYDIGLGGLDHVIATGADLNVFVIDTEVYSNTGGQSSKATPLGAVAQFQSAGKKAPKKDLGRDMMSYGNVYVAAVSMGASPEQLLRAISEAESYKGPSVIIAYTPCIAHGIKLGMGKAQEEMKRAVESGYWPIYRYDPRKETPFQLDCKEPSLPFTDFLEGELRFSAPVAAGNEQRNELLARAEKMAGENYEALRGMGV